MKSKVRSHARYKNGKKQVVKEHFRNSDDDWRQSSSSALKKDLATYGMRKRVPSSVMVSDFMKRRKKKIKQS